MERHLLHAVSCAILSILSLQVVSFLNTFQLSSGDNDNPRCQDHEDEQDKIDDGGVGGPILFPQPVFDVALEPQVLARKKRQFAFSPYQRDPYPLYSDVTKEFEVRLCLKKSNNQPSKRSKQLRILCYSTNMIHTELNEICLRAFQIYLTMITGLSRRETSMALRYSSITQMFLRNLRNKTKV